MRIAITRETKIKLLQALTDGVFDTELFPGQAVLGNVQNHKVIFENCRKRKEDELEATPSADEKATR